MNSKWMPFWVMLIVRAACGGEIMTWIRNTNFDNPNNWDIGRQPTCDRDTVIFPTSLPITVFIQQSVIVKSIVLPINGELILPRFGLLKVKNDKYQRHVCTGREMFFTAYETRNWFDPNNWKSSRSMDDSFIPDSERVPSVFNSVEFPHDSSFKVTVDGLNAEINTFSINGKPLSESELRLFLDSDTGKRQFQVKSGISLSTRSCYDLSGCSGGNERPFQLKFICSRLCPPTVHCADPITPVGFCCPICGAVISTNIGYRFHLKRFRDFVNSFTEKSTFAGVTAYVYKTYTGSVEAVFGDRGLPRRSAEMVRHILRELSTDSQKSYLDVVSVTSQVSNVWLDGSGAHAGEMSGLSGGSVAALVIGLLAIIIIVFLFYVQRHRLTPLAFSFGRFENEDENYVSSGFELAQPALDETHPPQKPPRKTPLSAQLKEPSVGFENPRYSTEEVEGVKEPSVIVSLSGDLGENPCYVAFERLEDIPEIKINESPENTTSDERK